MVVLLSQLLLKDLLIIYGCAESLLQYTGFS